MNSKTGEVKRQPEIPPGPIPAARQEHRRARKTLTHRTKIKNHSRDFY